MPIRAYDLTIFMLLLNASIFAASQLGLWSPEPAGEIYEIEDVKVPAGFPDVGVAPTSLFGLLAGISIGGVAILGARLTTPQVVAIVCFCLVFGWFMGSTVGILASFRIPGVIIALFGAMNAIILLAGAIQMAAGFSFKMGE